MATFDVTITESTAYTYRVEAKAGYEASAKAMLLYMDKEEPARTSEMVGEPRLAKPVLVTAEGQDPLPLDDE